MRKKNTEKRNKTIRGNNQNDGKMISMLINSAARLQKGLATRAKLNKSPAERGDKNAETKTQNLMDCERNWDWEWEWE